MVTQETQNIREQYSRQAQILAQARQSTQGSQFSQAQLRQLSRQGGARQAQVKLQVEKAKAIEEIGSKEKQLAQAAQEFETVAKPYESAIKDKAAYELALRLYRRGQSGTWFKKSNPAAYRYWKQMLASGEEARAEQEDIISQMQKQYGSGEKIVTEEYGSGVVKKLRVVGIESSKLGATVPIKEYNQALEKAYYSSQGKSVSYADGTRFELTETPTERVYAPTRASMQTDDLNNRIDAKNKEILQLNSQYEIGAVKREEYEKEYSKLADEANKLNEEARLRNQKIEEIKLREYTEKGKAEVEKLNAPLFQKKGNLFSTFISGVGDVVRVAYAATPLGFIGLPRSQESYQREQTTLKKAPFFVFGALPVEAPTIAAESKQFDKVQNEIKEFNKQFEQLNKEKESGKKTDLEIAEILNPKAARLDTLISRFTTPEQEALKRGLKYPSIAIGLTSSLSYLAPPVAYSAIAYGGLQTVESVGRKDYETALKVGIPTILAGAFMAKGSFFKPSPATAATFSTKMAVTKAVGRTTFGVGVIGLSFSGKQRETYAYGISSGMSEKEAKRLSIYAGIAAASPFAVMTGVGLYKDIKTIQQNRLAMKINEIKPLVKEGVVNIREKGIFNPKATYTGEEGGLGFKKLTSKETKAVAKDISILTGISQKEAKLFIKENLAGKVSFAIRDTNVPSLKRTISFLKGGKATTGSSTLKYSKYKVTSSITTPQGTKQIAFVFGLKGGKTTGMQVVQTVSSGNYFLQSTFEKARLSKKFPSDRLVLKEQFIGKIVKQTSGQIRGIDISAAQSSVKQLSKYPFGKQKIESAQAFNYGLANRKPEDLAQLWKQAGGDSKIGEVATFKNVRTSFRIFKGTDQLKISSPGEYGILEKSWGKKKLSSRDIISQLEQTGFFAQRANLQRPIRLSITTPAQQVEKLDAAISVKSGKSLKLDLLPKAKLPKGKLVTSIPVVATNLIPKPRTTMANITQLNMVGKMEGVKSASLIRSKQATDELSRLDLKPAQTQDVVQELKQREEQVVEQVEESKSKQRFRQAFTPISEQVSLETSVPMVTTNIVPRPQKPAKNGFGFGFSAGKTEEARRIAKKVLGSEGYKTFVISKGKKQVLSGIRTRKEALKLGEGIALKKAIATFGIEKTDKIVTGDMGEYTPSPAIFRSFKIKKGKRIPIKDTFIQKTKMEGGLKSGRLSFRGERKEVTRARKNARVKGIPWW